MRLSGSSVAPRREGGIALLTALILMLAVLMTGIASTRGALQSARAAAHERDRGLAVQMADSALFDAQRDIEGGLEPGSARANAIAHGDPDAFVGGCGGGRPYSGLCAHQPDAAQQAALLAEDDGPAVVFGSFTGSAMPEGEGGLPAEAPRYLIELMPASPDGQLYRITARGAGSMPGTYAALQAYYRKPLDGAPGRRVGWRELGNWSELYAAAGAGAAAANAAASSATSSAKSAANADVAAKDRATAAANPMTGKEGR
jgi:type IV pilus assembly protein PilX